LHYQRAEEGYGVEFDVLKHQIKLSASLAEVDDGDSRPQVANDPKQFKVPREVKFSGRSLIEGGPAWPFGFVGGRVHEIDAKVAKFEHQGSRRSFVLLEFHGECEELAELPARPPPHFDAFSERITVRKWIEAMFLEFGKALVGVGWIEPKLPEFCGERQY
jgi:hypothetical protein